ncbi:hypothetical protein OPS25_07945 [Alteromonas ponticola]|uniref:diguanylate cyclase n=1 Tax=Alteromonas aquimaris TaxID=2998417 RepID=A0ABT3P6N7_9ALTE|nr:diguanylate cyclase [Alteromonas aquimaris]MCW8108423.1 hypothetical protein [Alteromonas aquimaris]
METSESQAVQHAERLREKIEKSVVVSAAGPIKFTASFGVCGTVAGKFGQAPLLEDDLETMINVADEALYKVKAAGRNQVKAATQQELHYRRSKVKI